MGLVPMGPRPQYQGETDEHYHDYIHQEYRGYLQSHIDATPDVFKHWWTVTLLIVGMWVVILIFGAIVFQGISR